MVTAWEGGGGSGPHQPAGTGSCGRWKFGPTMQPEDAVKHSMTASARMYPDLFHLRSE
jgi:hypothetical protein